MRTTTRIQLFFAATLAFVPGCDEEYDDEFLLDDEEISERCVGSGCTVGGIGNTSRIGNHAVSNLSETFNLNTNNLSARVRINGGVGLWGPNKIPMTITEIDVEDDGELRLELSTAGWIQGTAVKGAYFNLTVTPNDLGKPAFNGILYIADVACEPGKQDPAMTICRYEFVTNVKPGDEVTYPKTTKLGGGDWWQTCPNIDEGGLLSGWEKYAAVLSPESTLWASRSSTPRIDVSPGNFILGCINGAVSKGQYFLNAFYDETAFRGLDPSQRSAMLLMWMAWHAGASRTQPGKLISPHDPIGGLFTWTAGPGWGIEGGYSSTGASCRGGTLSQGLHRNFISPVTTLTGWSSLPHCDATNLDSMAVLGVKVPTP